MASIRPSRSPAPPASQTSAETWAVRIAFGLMIAGMAGFVIYDLVSPGPARASSDEEVVHEEPTAQDVEPAAPAPTMTRRPSRLKSTPKTGRTRPASTRSGSIPKSRKESNSESDDEPREKPVQLKQGFRSFLGSPSRIRPSGRTTLTDRIRVAEPKQPEPEAEQPEPEQEPEQPEPEPAQPESEQPEAQPEQPAENAEGNEEGEPPAAEQPEETEEADPAH